VYIRVVVVPSTLHILVGLLHTCLANCTQISFDSSAITNHIDCSTMLYGIRLVCKMEEESLRDHSDISKARNGEMEITASDNAPSRKLHGHLKLNTASLESYSSHKLAILARIGAPRMLNRFAR
jgi:hypothetical protein